MDLNSVAVEDVAWIKGIPYPRDVHFRQIIVTGPPSSGKTTLIQKLQGWPEEGYLDLARSDWWRSRVLTFRPREVHFGFPFETLRESYTVFDREWLDAPAPIDLKRVQIPPGKRWFFNIDWRARFVFDFQLLSTERIYTIRKARARAGTHPVDERLTRDEVEKQVAVYETLALHFHRCGMQVIVRHTFDGMPRRIVDPEARQAADSH
jgi:hypothetical protein